MEHKYDIFAKEEYIEILDNKEPEEAQAYFSAQGMDVSIEDIIELKKGISDIIAGESDKELSEDELEDAAGGCILGYYAYKAIRSYINNSRKYNGGGGGSW